MFTKKVLLLFCLVQIGKGKIKCPLVWKEANLGETTPKDSVPAAMYGQNNFVARAGLENGVYILGRLDGGVLFSNYEGEVVENKTYEVLTNPHGCVLNWVLKSTNDFIVTAHSSQSQTKVARTNFEDVLLVGKADPSTIYFVDGLKEANNSTDFELLQAYSKGMSLEVTDFKFQGNPFNARPDMMGFDEIVNNSPATVKQTVYHKKRIFESSEITKTHKWGQVSAFSIGVQAKISASACGVGSDLYELDKTLYEKQFNADEGEDVEQIYDSGEFLVESHREVSVPPYSSVQFCSTVTVYENFVAEYEAKGIYSAPGLNFSEVAQLLSEDDLVGIPDGDTIVIKRYGTFLGSMAMQTEFITMPANHVGLGGCLTLSAAIAKLKRDLAFGKIKSNVEYNRRLLSINAQHSILIGCPGSNSTSTTTASPPVTQTKGPLDWS